MAHQGGRTEGAGRDVDVGAVGAQPGVLRARTFDLRREQTHFSPFVVDAALNDSPISKPDEDLYGLDPFAKAIARAMEKMPAPEGVVLPINGPWGESANVGALQGRSAEIGTGVLIQQAEAALLNVAYESEAACWGCYRPNADCRIQTATSAKTAPTTIPRTKAPCFVHHTLRVRSVCARSGRRRDIAVLWRQGR